MQELEQMLRTILNEKTNKILPENIKKGVTVFGVMGILEDETNTNLIVEKGKTYLIEFKEEVDLSQSDNSDFLHITGANGMNLLVSKDGINIGYHDILYNTTNHDVQNDIILIRSYMNETMINNAKATFGEDFVTIDNTSTGWKQALTYPEATKLQITSLNNIHPITLSILGINVADEINLDSVDLSNYAWLIKSVKEI